MTMMGEDQAGITHILRERPDGFYEGLCGHGTGGPEFRTEADQRRVGFLLINLERGCMQCANIAVPMTKKEKARG